MTMEADYLVLKGSRKVRVEWNMNSMGAFTQDTGIEISNMANGKADIFVMRKLAWYMAKEGEEIEGRFFELTEVELGRMLDQAETIRFMKIFAMQTSTTEQKKSSGTNLKGFPTIFFRKKG